MHWKLLCFIIFWLPDFFQIFHQTGDTLATRCHIWLGPSLKLLTGNRQFNRFQGLWLCLVMYLQSCSSWFGFDFGMWIPIHMAFHLVKTSGMIMQCPPTRNLKNILNSQRCHTHTQVPLFSAALRGMHSNVFQQWHGFFHFMFLPKNLPQENP